MAPFKFLIFALNENNYVIKINKFKNKKTDLIKLKHDHGAF